MDTKIINNVYHAGTVSAIMLGNSWAMKRFFKMKSVNLDKIDIKDAVKLTVNILGSTIIRDWLVAQGIIPENIMK